MLARIDGFVPKSRTTEVAFGQTADATVVLALDYGVAETVVVVGSRRADQQRSVTESAVPVDVLSAEALSRQPNSDIAEVLRTLAPSFNVNTQPISDAATVVRPTNLRNLAPDHFLFLVNGKRRHRSAVITWLGNGIADGSQGPDISIVPTIAVRQIELLRDGAAAQYGSDAIAGVVNVQLKDRAPGREPGDPLRIPPGRQRRQPGNLRADGLMRSDRKPGHPRTSVAGNIGLPIGTAGFAKPQPRARRGRTHEPGDTAGRRPPPGDRRRTDSTGHRPGVGRSARRGRPEDVRQLRGNARLGPATLRPCELRTPPFDRRVLLQAPAHTGRESSAARS